MATTINGYPNGKIDRNPLSADEVNTLSDGSELHHVNLSQLFGVGCLAATDWNLSVVAGQIALSISAGKGIVGDSGERKVCETTTSVTIDSDQGLAAGSPTTYYVFKKRDLTDESDPATGFVAQTSATAPADSILIGTASMGASEAASVDNLPAERINLRNPIVLSGLAADRPTYGVAGRFYFATDNNGGTLYHDTGSAWQQCGPGTSETHVLATTTAIGPRHSVSGLTAGQILNAISATGVAFEAPGTRIIMAGTAASRPAAAIDGKLYYETDTGLLKRDTGAAWVTVGVSRLGDTISGSVAIDAGGTAPGASAILHVRSTSKGAIAAPVMTTAQGDAISSPATGLQVYDSDVTALRAYGVRWSYRSGTLFSGTADATVGNTTTETSCVPASGAGAMNLYFGYLAVGKTLRFTGIGYISETGTPTLRIKLKLNTTLILDTTAFTLPASLSNSEFRFEFLLTCRSTGASGTVYAQGYLYTGGTRTAIVKTATVTVNTTSNHTPDVTAQWGTADAANTLTVTNFLMEALP